jgi:hypothetical protein
MSLIYWALACPVNCVYISSVFQVYLKYTSFGRRQDMEITDEQIRKLAVEAVEAGDQMMTSICEGALEGDGTARAICEIIIDDAIGMLP